MDGAGDAAVGGGAVGGAADGDDRAGRAREVGNGRHVALRPQSSVRPDADGVDSPGATDTDVFFASCQQPPWIKWGSHVRGTREQSGNGDKKGNKTSRSQLCLTDGHTIASADAVHVTNLLNPARYFAFSGFFEC